MAVIHAFRRVKRTVHEFGGTDYIFAPNSLGDVICDVQHEPAVERFLSIDTAFKLYDRAVVAPEVPQAVSTPIAEQTTLSPVLAATVASDASQPPAPQADPLRFTLDNGDQKLDLLALDDKQLREFAKANELTVPKSAKGDVLRTVIFNALKAPANEVASDATNTGEAGGPPPAADAVTTPQE